MAERLLIIRRTIRYKVFNSISTAFIWLYTQHNRFVVTIQVSWCHSAPTVKNWKILLEQSFTAYMPLLMSASTFQQCATIDLFSL